MVKGPLNPNITSVGKENTVTGSLKKILVLYKEKNDNKKRKNVNFEEKMRFFLISQRSLN